MPSHKNHINKNLTIQKCKSKCIYSVTIEASEESIMTIYFVLRENCWYSEFFLSVFSLIGTEYGEILRIQSECGKIRTKKIPNTDTFHTVMGMHSAILSLSFEVIISCCKESLIIETSC